MSKKYDLAVFIGRMAPFHNAHLENIRTAALISHKVLVILGSSNAPRDERNPFSNIQRQTMLDVVHMNHLHREFDGKVKFVFDVINDNPSNDMWAASVYMLAYKASKPDAKIAIVGHKKDESSFYLDMFPNWDFIETGAHMYGDEEMAATKIRDLMFTGQFDQARDMMPEASWRFVNSNFIGSDVYLELKEEYNFHKAYPAHRRANYPINDVTADAVVICKSHILLIRRKNVPGKGKLALPGGFVNINETVLDAMLRELDEETKIHVPKKVLRGSITDELRFDKPNRSLRGRIMTFAFTIQLDANLDGTLPRVYGSDDAEKAFWEPLSNVIAPEKAVDFFEDHHNIVMTMIGRAAKQDK